MDKDVAVAKEHFGLQAAYDAMSPLVLYKGYTKDFLDGKVRCTRKVQALSVPRFNGTGLVSGCTLTKLGVHQVVEPA